MQHFSCLEDIDGLVVYPANTFDSRLRGDWVPLGSSPTKYQKMIILAKATGPFCIFYRVICLCTQFFEEDFIICRVISLFFFTLFGSISRQKKEDDMYDVYLWFIARHYVTRQSPSGSSAALLKFLINALVRTRRSTSELSGLVHFGRLNTSFTLWFLLGHTTAQAGRIVPGSQPWCSHWGVKLKRDNNGRQLPELDDLQSLCVVA